MINEALTIPDTILWQAVTSKNREFDGMFYFGVRTTGIFCRPSCSSRTPNRENVDFFSTPVDACAAGFRACKRCEPENEEFTGPSATLIRRAFGVLSDEAAEVSNVDDLCVRLGVSRSQLQKTFSSSIGLSPKEVLDQVRLARFRQNVKAQDIAASLYDSGFGSSRALYETAAGSLGMTPANYKKGGKGIRVRYSLAGSPVGKLLVAATDKGICSIMLGDDVERLEADLREEFFAAAIEKDDAGLHQAMETVVKSLDGARSVFDLPMDVRATAFQLRVWSELRKIPFGETRTYSGVADSIGSPTAVRAVARACATNPTALINPCHRVIGADGNLSGYRWGIERKKRILERERSISVGERETAAAGGK